MGLIWLAASRFDPKHGGIGLRFCHSQRKAERFGYRCAIRANRPPRIPQTLARPPLPLVKTNATTMTATTAIHYRITPVHPEAHLFEVSCTVSVGQDQDEGLRFALPAWIPGSYMVREFARNIVEIRAESGDGKGRRRVALDKIDKHTWQAASCKGSLTLTYTVYAWDLSVRCAHLDQTHGFFNGTGVFLRVVGHEDIPHVVDIRKPDGEAYKRWRVATSLPELKAKRYGFGTYRASNYDDLVDHPVEMGSFALASFEACGTQHDIVVTGRVPNLDMPRLCVDMERICAAQIRFFEPKSAKAPFERYVFLIMAVGDGYGGLEHRASTALICKRDDLPARTAPAKRKAEAKGVATTGPTAAEISDGYCSFLGLVSHEYFHSWNVKRIKPAAFAPYGFDREAYTSLLWIFEGFTSYYDDLFLLRTGLIDAGRYLKMLAKTISTVERGSGRTKQSVAESSFDAWTKYYRQDENSPNAIVSYYAKGSLVALALDLHLRGSSGGKKSLDDVMRTLWLRFGRDFYPDNARGLTENEFPAVVAATTGIDVSKQVREWAYGYSDLPLQNLLLQLGINFSGTLVSQAPSLGVKLAAGAGECKLAVVHDGSAAQIAGLSAGDILLAVDGLRVSAGNLDSLLSRYAVGDSVEVHAFRRDELLQTIVKLAADPSIQVTLQPENKGPGVKLRKQWIGS